MADRERNPAQITFYDAVTDFLFMEDAPRRCDVILLPGNNRPDCALRAAALYREGYAGYVLPSGRFSKLTGRFVPASPDDPYLTSGADASPDKPDLSDAGTEMTEWTYLSRILIAGGVPRERILREDRATFTWENAIFSRQVLEKEGISVKTALLCCQAFHARRAWMYYKQQFPDTALYVIPVNTRGITRDNWYLSKEKTDVVLGEMQRIGEQFHCCLPLL